MRAILGVNDVDLPRDITGHVVCALCGGLTIDWPPVEGATWYECADCGDAVLALDAAPEAVEEQERVRW